MKKAQMLQFLFYTILALVIFVPTILFASKFLALRDKPLESFNQLSSLIDNIKASGDRESMPLFMDPDNLIIGFSKDTDKVEVFEESALSGILNSEIRLIIEKPPQCEDAKSCICLCKGGIERDGKNLECTEKVICNSFDKIDFFEERPVADIPFFINLVTTFETKWINGFFLTNSREGALLRTLYPLDKAVRSSNIPQRLTVYVQRYREFVNVCLNAEKCITDDMIDNLNKEEAIEEFKRFENFYNACRDNDECGTFDLSLPERYFVYYRKSPPVRGQLHPVDTIYLINTKNKDIEVIKNEYRELRVMVDNKDISFKGNLYNEENRRTDSTLVEGNFELKKEEDKIVFKSMNLI